MSIQTLSPTYKLNGELWRTMDEISAGAVSYFVQTFPWLDRSNCIPNHAKEACKKYRETIRDLISAGF